MRGFLAKTKLRNKIISLVVMICVFTLLGMSLASYVTIKKLSNHSARTNMVLGDEAAGSAGDALMAQAHKFLMIIAQQQSRNCNSLIKAIQYNVDLLEGVTTDIFNHPEYYSHGRPVIKPSEAVRGVYSGTYILPAGVPMTENIRRELDLLSNLGLILPTLTNNPDIIEFYVGLESGLFYNYTPLSYKDPEYDPRTRPWYVQAVEHPERVIFTEIYEDALGSGAVMTAAKAVFNGKGDLLGVVALDILLENMKKLILETRILESGYAFIVNNEGRYIIHPKMGEEGFQAGLPEGSPGPETDTAEGYRRMKNGETGFVKVYENGAPVFIAFSPISVTGWSLGVTVNEDELLSALAALSTRMALLTDEAKKNTAAISDRAIVAFMAVLAAVALMVVLLSVALAVIISRPVQKLAQEVSRIGGGVLEAKIEGSYNDELDKIKDAVNSMAEDIKTYMADNIQAESKLAESRISIMLSQIQPHFLYNALTAIARLCNKDPVEARKATINFAHYLRGNMESLTEKGLMPVEKELKHIEAYLDLEKAIYGTALMVVFNIESTDFELPTLSVQPIVENAVKHGIGRREGGGTVTVSVREAEDAHIITVADDGPGFDFIEYARTNDLLKCVGIENVRRRLAAMCGGSLDIESATGAGTTVTIRIPMSGKEAR